MFTYCYLVLIYSFGFILNCNCLSCPNEYLFFIKENKTFKIEWTGSNHEIVTSNPVCVNKNNIIITRTCQNGKWYPEEVPRCIKTQESFIPTCPKNHNSYQNKLCIFISKPQPWTRKTPVIDILNITASNILRILHKEYNVTEMWLPVRRNRPYGKFIQTLPRSKYIKYTHELLKESFKIGSRIEDCIFITNIRIRNNSVFYEPKITSCNSSYPTVHVYVPEAKYYVAGKYLYYSVTSSKSFYLRKFNKDIKKTCKKHAEPLTPEDNFVIKRLTKNVYSKIGIDMQNNSEMIWSNSKLAVNYSDWRYSKSVINTTDINSNSVVVLNENGWALIDEKNVSFAVCEMDHNKYITDLVLKPSKNYSELVLTSYSHHEFINIVCSIEGLEDLNFRFRQNAIKVTNRYEEVYSSIEKLDNRTVWLLESEQKKYSYYQCVGILYPDAKVTKTRKILFGKTKCGREFAFEATIKSFCKSNICDPHLSDYYFDIEKFFLKQIPTPKILFFRAINIIFINYTTGDIRILFHVRTSEKIENINAGFYLVKKLLLDKINGSHYNSYNITVHKKSIKSCHGCMATETGSGKNKLIWKFTVIGSTAVPYTSIPCLQWNKLPVTRKCAGDFLHGGEWLEVEGQCDDSVIYSYITKSLKKLDETHSTMPVIDVVNTLTNLTKNEQMLEAIDVYYVSKILQNISQSTKQLENVSLIAKDVTLILSNLIASNVNSLDISGNRLNATNVLLASTERFMEKITQNILDIDGVYKEVTPNLIYYTANPFINNMTGIALIRPNVSYQASFTDYTILTLTSNSSIDELISLELLEIAAFVPKLLLDNIKMNSENKTVKISIRIFYNNSLFIEEENTRNISVGSKILSISISGYENYLYSSIPVIIKINESLNRINETYCGYWDFGSIASNEIYPHQWSIDNGTPKTMIAEKNILICNFTHLTDFTLLLGLKVSDYYNTSTEQQLMKSMENVLNYLTATGCILSTIGICGIFITAIQFKCWREKIGTKVLLNVSASILLQMIVFYLNSQDNQFVCILTGSLLHYSVLSGFFWSLIMAFLQYIRFVRIIGGTTSHLLLKASMIGWLVPLIPVSIVLALSPDNYMPTMEEVGKSMCYPQGIVLYATVFVPVGTIVIANLIIFYVILYNISWKTSIPKNHQNISDRRMIIQQLKLAILLFFLFGLTWIFGILGATRHCIDCLYLFCATATMQGFILFLFYVVLDQNTRNLWTQMIKSKIRASSQATSSGMVRPTVETNTSRDDLKDTEQTPEWNTQIQSVMHELKRTHRFTGEEQLVTRRTH